MQKELDPYRVGMDLYRDLGSWRRGMVRETLLKRFPTISARPSLLDGIVVLPEGALCPVCKSDTRAKSETFWANGKQVTVYYPQCVYNWTRADHGYSRASPHGWRASQGRKGSAEEKPETPVPEPVPVPKPGAHVVDSIVSAMDVVVHPELIRMAKYAHAGERNFIAYGPAGTGKSYAMEHQFGRLLQGDPRWSPGFQLIINGYAGKQFTEDAGYLDRLNGGVYVTTPVVEALQKPGIVVKEEYDKDNPNTAAAFWNNVLASDTIITPGGTFKRHPDCVVVFIGNTTGHNPSKAYGGSVRQDFATLDRFRVLTFDYNKDVEFAAIPGLTPELYGVMTKMREAAETSGLQRILGSRWAKRVHTTMKVEGLSATDAVEKICKDEHWTDEERRAAGL